MKVAHFGTFDVENYGDLLFPLLLEKRLAHLNATFVHVSPSGGKPAIADCLDCQSIRSVVESAKEFDAAILAGGNLVHDGLSKIPKYQATGLYGATYPALWLTPTVMNSCFDIPVCWNASGVGRDLTSEIGGMIAWAMGGVTYGCVRDECSRERLEDQCQANISVCVDTALEVSSLWSQTEIEEAYRSLLSRKGVNCKMDTIAFHFRTHYISESREEIAEIIQATCRASNAIPILVAIGNCHGDGSYARDIANMLGSDVIVLDDPKSLREIAASIALSKAYIGSSLHGAITAYSYGVRCLVVAPLEASKFSGFLSRVGGEDWRSESWSDTHEIINDFLHADISIWKGACDRLKPELDLHWKQIIEALSSKQAVPDKILQNQPFMVMPEIPLEWASLLILWQPLTRKFDSAGLGGVSIDMDFFGRIYNLLQDVELCRSDLKKQVSKINKLESKLKNQGKIEGKRTRQLKKLREAVNSLYHSNRWKIGNYLSGKGWGNRGVIKYEPLERSLNDLISDHKNSLSRNEDSKVPGKVPFISSEAERKCNFLFITGCQRSGTTAATKLLTHHREIAVGMERFKYLRKEEVMAQEFTADCFLKENFFNYKKEETNLIPKENGGFDQEFFINLENNYDQVKWVGDKNPTYFFVYKDLLQRFQGCRILVVHRNPFDIAYSWNVRAGSEQDKWPKENDYAEAVKNWNLCIEKTLECAADFPDQILVVEYERLFCERGYYRRLLDWLRVSSDGENEKYYQAMSEKAAELKKKDRRLSVEQADYVAKHARLDLESTLLHLYAL